MKGLSNTLTPLFFCSLIAYAPFTVANYNRADWPRWKDFAGERSGVPGNHPCSGATSGK